MFDSKIEAYLYAIYCLRTLTNEEAAQPFIVDTISKIRIAIENHRQDPPYVSRLLVNLSERLQHHHHSNLLMMTAMMIRESNYELSLPERFENPLARRFESQLPIQILLTPTPAIMASVYCISEKIIGALMQIESMNLDYDFFSMEEDFFLSSLVGPQELGFGAFSKTPDLNEFLAVLLGNNPANLAQIMYIHFMFAQNVFRRFDFINLAPQRAPIGQMLKIVSKQRYAQDPAHYFVKLTKEKNRYISDTLLYEGPFYSDRGRLEEFQPPEITEYRFRMGLMLDEDGYLNNNIPTQSTPWAADVKFQKPDFNSPFTRYLLENDAVYVAGPSGMTSLFLGQMENFANFNLLSEKQSYLAAVVAYLVAGGFHSLHEIIGPAEYGLGLVPGYHAFIPEKKYSPPAPNFHRFFSLLMAHDPDFRVCYDKAWNDLDNFFEYDYLPATAEIDPEHSFHLRDILVNILRGYIAEQDNRFFFNPSEMKQLKQVKTDCIGVESAHEEIQFVYNLMTQPDLKWIGLMVAKELGFSSLKSACIYYQKELESYQIANANTKR